MKTTRTEVLRIAEQIVSVLPAGTFMRVCSDDRDTIRYAVRAEDVKLRSVVLSRGSLQRLATDPARPVKIEYLQKELLEAVEHRGEFRYPRTVRRASCTPVTRIAPPRLTPLASGL
jgi:hypothetical protein